MESGNFNLSLIIPLFNESERIPLLQRGLLDFLKDCSYLELEIILVNDASRDDTLDKLHELKEELMASFPDKKLAVEIIELKQNILKGGALRQGVLQAQGDWILTLDADMATEPSQLFSWEKKGWLKLNQPTKGVEKIFIGSREEPESKVSDQSYRRLMGKCFNFCVRLITGLKINDTQCGFKLYPKEIAKRCFYPLREFGWAHDVEILKRIRHQGGKIQVLPITWKAVAVSKIKPVKDSLNMFWALFKIQTFYLLDMLPAERNKKSK